MQLADLQLTTRSGVFLPDGVTEALSAFDAATEAVADARRGVQAAEEALKKAIAEDKAKPVGAPFKSIEQAEQAEKQAGWTLERAKTAAVGTYEGLLDVIDREGDAGRAEIAEVIDREGEQVKATAAELVQTLARCEEAVIDARFLAKPTPRRRGVPVSDAERAEAHARMARLPDGFGALLSAASAVVSPPAGPTHDEQARTLRIYDPDKAVKGANAKAREAEERQLADPAPLGQAAGQEVVEG